MPRPAITWLITDTHFYHDRIKEPEFEGRPDDFNEQIVRNLRHLVADQDLLIHLGDVIFYRHTELKSILDSVKGRKILTMGNHDRKSRSWYMRNGFDLAIDSFTIDGVLFSHKPTQILPDDVTINIHGHLHTKSRHKPDWYDSRTHKLLAIELTNYEPVKLSEFLQT